MDEIVLRGSFCMDFTKMSERSRVDYWIVKEEFTSRSQTLGTSLRFIVMVLSVSERQMFFFTFDLFFVGSVFDMPTDGKHSCLQQVGGAIGCGS